MGRFLRRRRRRVDCDAHAASRADALLPALSTTGLFLLATTIVFAAPCLVWRLARTEHWAPPVVVQIVTGLVLEPGLLGRAFPAFYARVFDPVVVPALNRLAAWAAMRFVWIAGIELELKAAWRERRDVAIRGVLALILLDWQRVGRQAVFLLAFALAAWARRRPMRRPPERDHWCVGVIWLALRGFGADGSGLHFVVGAFLAGAVLDAEWFGRAAMDRLRQHVLHVPMPALFLSTGLKTAWTLGGTNALLVAAPPLVASVAGSFTALLRIAVASTMLTAPIVAPRLRHQADADAKERAASPPSVPASARSAAVSSAARTDAPR